MLTWYVKRKALLGLLSTLCCVTVALHTLLSLNWTRRDSAGNRANLAEIGEKAGFRHAGSINSARQLTSFDNLNAADNQNGNGAVMVKELAEEYTKKSKDKQTSDGPSDKKNEKLTVTNEELDDDEEFTGCRGKGTVDMSAYPFVDARRIYCGEVRGPGKEIYIRAPGAIPAYLLNTMLIQRGSNLRNGGNIREMLILGQDPPMRLVDVLVTGEMDPVIAKGASLMKNAKQNELGSRQLQLNDDTTYNAGPILFFPPSLSEQKRLMRFLREMYRVCVLSRGGHSVTYAATVQRATVNGQPLPGPLCVYMGVVAGGIREAYLIGMRKCRKLTLPKTIKLCYLNDVKV